MHSERGMFVTGIGTGVGKTVVSAVLVRALEADYWKPIQCGSLDLSDTKIVAELSIRDGSRAHPERFRLPDPLSPHLAARNAKIKIALNDFKLPESNRPIIVEGAGGVFSPISDEHLNVDLAQALNLPIVLVSRHYLGSINHTLLSIEAILSRNLSLLGVAFVGSNQETESFILNRTKVRRLINIPEVEALSAEQIERWAAQLRMGLQYVASAA